MKEWNDYTAVCAQTVHLKFDTFSQYADHRYHEAAIPLVTISLARCQKFYGVGRSDIRFDVVSIFRSSPLQPVFS